ncbi:MAG: type I restriction endonuclease subunit R [Cyclobacteriaceae bacterium]|nr:type I restriction endonuclease subunit R [Cyclobacteriaceae bacterium]
MKPITENIIEESAIEILQSQGWEYANGKEISPEGLFCERDNYSQIVLVNRLRNAIAKINPEIPLDAQEAAVQKVLRIASPELLHNNEEFHRLLVEKVKIPYQQNGYERSHEVALVDFDNPLNNQFTAINQYTIIENNQNKRPDVLLFVNGLPLVVIELKNAASENANIKSAYQQIQTYKAIIPSLFIYNSICILSDGLECKAGSVSADLSRYMTWKTADGIKEASRFKPQLETLLKGMLQPATLLDLVRNFIVFEKSKKEDSKTGLIQIQTVKKLAAYHQYYAVNKAVQSSVVASSINGDKRGGVVWHTQGSGKSLSMVFYSGKLITSPEMKNPTIVVITDRNDLDDQLFDTFASSVQLLRQEPVQAENREHLKELLKVASGGIVFTTIQKFLPENNKSVYDQLSDRKNVVVIADEAHRTQYGFEAKLVDEKDKETKEVIGKRIAYGFAKYMRDALPNATYIGFTGTPIEGTDVNTPQVFGNYIDRYDIKDAVDDGATVKIFYESRLAKVNLDEQGRRLIEEFDKELEQDEEVTEKQKAKAKWTKLEAIVGNQERVKNLAKDIVSHFEKRQTVFEGKAMIVAMSRRIAADLYAAIIALRPEWHNDDMTKGFIKVVMTTNSADGPEISKHHTTKQQRKDLSERMKDPDDELKLVIVRDMWLTGFDAPCLNTMYVDKPMRGHNLMQAIARVNRVFKDKPGGLIVDYLGIGTDLKKALSFYGEAGGKGDPAENIERAFEIFKEKLEIIQQMFNEDSATRKDILVEEPEAYFEGSFKFNYRRFFAVNAQEKLSIILQTEEHILGLQDGKERFIREVSLLSQALSLCITKEEVQPHLPEVAFFQAVKARLAKFDAPTGGGRTDLEIETAIKQIVDEALSSDKVIDIFDAAGIDKPEISGLEILSDEFLMEVEGMQHKNLAIELLKKILNNELKARAKTNLVKSKKLLEMLEGAIKRYQNNLLTTAEIIQELINIAKQIKEADKEGEKLGLNNDEVAFYNALEINDSAVQVLGDDTLKEIAREIADKVRANATIDWTIRESARAKLMVLVKRTLSKYGYPPDKQQKAIDTVLKQAELLANFWTEED